MLPSRAELLVVYIHSIFVALWPIATGRALTTYAARAEGGPLACAKCDHPFYCHHAPFVTLQPMWLGIIFTPDPGGLCCQGRGRLVIQPVLSECFLIHLFPQQLLAATRKLPSLHQMSRP